MRYSILTSYSILLSRVDILPREASSYHRRLSHCYSKRECSQCLQIVVEPPNAEAFLGRKINFQYYSQRNWKLVHEPRSNLTFSLSMTIIARALQFHQGEHIVSIKVNKGFKAFFSQGTSWSECLTNGVKLQINDKKPFLRFFHLYILTVFRPIITPIQFNSRSISVWLLYEACNTVVTGVYYCKKAVNLPLKQRTRPSKLTWLNLSPFQRAARSRVITSCRPPINKSISNWTKISFLKTLLNPKLLFNRFTS